MNEDRFGELIGELARESDPAPETPREEIWTGISAARRFRAPRRRPVRQQLAWGLSLAATLALGFVLGRGWLPASESETDGRPRITAVPANDDGARAPRSFRLAAADYLARTEALLSEFPGEAREGDAHEVAGWARQLLLDTRLLQDSPAGGDPEIAPLLNDLELVLAQIASLRGDDADQEIRLIVDGIQQNRVMARLRVAAGTNGDD